LTRERVRAAGRAQIERVGLEGLSLREVARSLDVTAAALYAHIDGKRGLVSAIAEDAYAELTRRFAAIDADDSIERIRAQSEVYVTFALESPRIYEVMMRYAPELPGAPPAGAVPTSERATSLVANAMGAVSAAIEEGRLVVDDAVVATLVLWSAAHGVVTTLSAGFELPARVRAQVIRTAIDTTVRGLTVGEDQQ
jgi:AcrR family transcriptional regulator